MQLADGLICPTQGLVFQSSLELSPECNGNAVCVVLESHHVSILTRAFARVQLRVDKPTLYRTITVSILTRAFARVQRKLDFQYVITRNVSILTRAFARVQRECIHSQHRSPSGFNPHSSFRPSATPINGPSARCRSVSILTRAFARVQPKKGSNVGWHWARQMWVFNVPWPISRPARTSLGFDARLGFARLESRLHQSSLKRTGFAENSSLLLKFYPTSRSSSSTMLASTAKPRSTGSGLVMSIPAILSASSGYTESPALRKSR